MAEESELSEETKNLLKGVVDVFEKEDEAVRVFKLKHYRRLKLYWNSISNIYWSQTTGDYRIYGGDATAQNSDQGYYDRPVNVFRAFLETIIAALSIEIPRISCAPDDADKPDDQSTAKAGDKIAELLYKHNDAIFIWLRALYLHCTEGMVACYQYEKSDKAFGTYNEKQYKDEKVEAYACPHCAARLEDAYVQSFQQGDPAILEQTTEQVEDEALEFTADEFDEFAPDDDDIDLHDEMNKGLVCPECGVELDPELQKSKLIIPRFVGMTQKPKSRVCFDLFGELYVKVAGYARTQEDTPYLIWSYETNYVNVLEKYPHLWDKLPKGGNAPTDPYEQYARLNPQYRDTYPEQQVTVKNAWLRPAAFNALTEAQSKELHSKYPDGCRVVIVESLVAEACNENLDDCWTLTKNPLSDYLTYDPLGELLINIQDIVNDLISLILQTIEQGIPQTWADPAVVNFEAYSQLEAQPGTITPTKLQGGAKNISEAFFATKASSLSPEVFQFYQIINQLGQFVSAAMPSIFGGSQDSGSSRTASEYALSRTAGLQRLQTPFRMFTFWWKNVFGKAIPAYMKLLKEDEHFSKKQKDGNYINIWIRKAELTGKIGDIELEPSDTLPISDEQKAEWIMKLMELNNETIMLALTSPENLPMLRKVVKIPELKVPGEDDRTKQYEEIQELINSEPIVIEPDPMQIEQAAMQGAPPEQVQMMMQPMEQPSIEVDPIVDNHEIEAATCRSWLVGEAGRLAKLENPLGYKNVLLHMKAHLDILMQQQAEQMAQEAAMQQQGAPPEKADGKQNPPNKKPKEPGDSSERITGEQDVRAPIQ